MMKPRYFRRSRVPPVHLFFFLASLAFTLLFLLIITPTSEPANVSSNSMAANKPKRITTPATVTVAVHKPRQNVFNATMEARLPAPSRPEPPVNMTSFYQCMAQRLAVNMQTHTQYELVPGDTVPMMLFPFMMEVADLRALVCSMNTTIRYVVFVVNGGIPEVSAFFDDLEAAFGWTGRLTVHRNYENPGFSASVNTGIAAALSKPIEEVPFLFVSNIDVRYMVNGKDVLTHRVRRFHAELAKDGDKIAQLEAEVAAEQSAQMSGGNRSLRGAWSPNATLVTSALLPDRIRYMSREEQGKAFADHHGWLAVHQSWQGCAFGLSRLAMLTAGYWDENFFPAYSEDYDYYWRVRKLGFHFDLATRKDGNAEHYVNAIQKAAKVEKMRNKSLVSPRAVQLLDEFSWFIIDSYNYGKNYIIIKWGIQGAHAPTDKQYHMPFEHSGDHAKLPMDAWVRDAAYAQQIFERNRARSFSMLPRYNVSVIRPFKE